MSWFTKKPHQKNVKAIDASDAWWQSFDTDEPGYYQRIDLGNVVIHLCGSRKKLAEVHNAMFPQTPYNPEGSTYMFTGFGGVPPAHVWLVVNRQKGRTNFHKWAGGHELVRALSCFQDGLLNADAYTASDSYP